MISSIFKPQASIRQAQVAARFYTKVLQRDSLSENVKNAEYAVRGKIPLRGEEIQNDINKGNGSKYNFTTTTSLNIGNPQAVGQGHITFNREVISGLINPALLKTNALSEDAKNRALTY